VSGVDRTSPRYIEKETTRSVSCQKEVHHCRLGWWPVVGKMFLGEVHIFKN
jgi:hypothetical protein